MEEQELLAKIRALVDRPTPPDLLVANGDDGAVFSAGASNVVVATDIAVEGIHFQRKWSSAFEIGRKIAAANLADICAMGGWPRFLLVSAVIPENFLDEVTELSRGIAMESDLVGAQVIGGDISTGDSIIINITAIGYCDSAIKRSGARAGDYLVISHLPGWSAVGLELLRTGRTPKNEEENRALSQHKSPTIPYQRYKSAFTSLRCATDISDGLLVDASHLAAASNVKINIDSALIRNEMNRCGLDKLEFPDNDLFELVLTSGEEHVLLGSVANPADLPDFIVIGSVSEGAGVSVDDQMPIIKGSGFQHRWG